MPATLVAGPFLVSHSFLLLVLFPQKPLADILFWGVPRELTSNLSSLKTSMTHLFRFSILATFHFVNFPD